MVRLRPYSTNFTWSTLQNFVPYDLIFLTENMQIWYYLSVKKAKMILSRKNTLKDGTFGIITKKMIFILENMVFLLMEKLKITKTFTLLKSFQRLSA